MHALAMLRSQLLLKKNKTRKLKRNFRNKKFCYSENP